MAQWIFIKTLHCVEKRIRRASACPGHLAVTGFKAVEVTISLGGTAVRYIATANIDAVHLFEVGVTVLATVHVAVCVSYNDALHATFATQEISTQSLASTPKREKEAMVLNALPSTMGISKARR